VCVCMQIEWRAIAMSHTIHCLRDSDASLFCVPMKCDIFRHTHSLSYDDDDEKFSRRPLFESS
jgi:hypothetical protein